MYVKVHICTLVTILILCMFLNTYCCPLQCICKWKNGKQSAVCIGKDLGSIPKNLDTETQVLDLSKNNLQILHREVFQKFSLINLQKIYLSQCRLQKIDDFAFKGLTNLVELDLSENLLTYIPFANFINFPSLMRLILSKNPIVKIKSQTFHHLTYLNSLEMSYCKIEEIEADALAGLAHLEWLSLDGNKLKTIRGDTVLPNTLKGVELQNNNWNCDCELQDLYAWLLNINIPHNVEPVCYQPERLARKTIKSLASKDLACLPSIKQTANFIEIDVGKNVSLECKVMATPEVKISWWFQGQLLQNDSIVAPGLHLIYFIEKGSHNKTSELSIYNTDLQDDGTYICTAENEAGKSQANFSIKIILKKEPFTEEVAFPHKYLILLIAVFSVIFLLTLIILITIITKCKKNSKRRKKKESGIDVALQNQCNSGKRTTNVSEGSIFPKLNGSIVISTQENTLHYPLADSREFTINVPNELIFSPNSLRTYVENNPDLIHDAEGIDKRNENDFKNIIATQATNDTDENFDQCLALSLPQTVPRHVRWRDQQKNGCHKLNTMPRLIQRELFQQRPDMRVNSSYYLDAEGYPADFGLPKVPCRVNSVIQVNTATPAYYQTLPHNKKVKRLSQYAKDTEFNSPTWSNALTGFDVRYTADGYPCTNGKLQTNCTNSITLDQKNDISYIPSPPEGYKTEAPSQCYNGGQEISANILPCMIQHRTPVISQIQLNNSCCHVQTRCVNTQTSSNETWSSCCEESSLKAHSMAKLEIKQEISTESPDEGYVGDGVESSET